MNEVNSKAIPKLSGGSPSSVSKWARGAKVFALAGLSVIGVAAQGTASAQIVSPPPFPLEVTVFPMRDFLGIGGFAPGADVLIQVRRGNSVVGFARGPVAPADPLLQLAGGDLEVNHPGGICWSDVTPDITGNDVIQVTYDNTPNNQQLGVPIGSGNSVRTANAVVTQAATIVGDTVVIKGKALQGITAIPLNRIEVRIINPDFREPTGIPDDTRITKRDIRADSAGGNIDGVPGARGQFTYDARTTACPVGCFTAVFTGLNAVERQLAVEGQTRVLSWMATDAAANRLGMTIYEAGEVGGPGMGGCPDGPGGGIGPNPPAYPVAYNPLDLVNAAFPPADPSLLHEIVVFPSRDFVSPSGFPIGQEMQIVVRRPDPNNPNNPNGVIVGTARGTTVNAEGSGMMEVNHPGGLCWSGQTPDIRAGDKVDMFRIVNGAFAGGETQEVIGVAINGAAFVNAANEVIIEGTMPAGWPLPRLEQRIIQPAFSDIAGSRIERRDIRADQNGGRVGKDPGDVGFGWLTATSETTWRVRYTGLNAVERALALTGQSRIMAWLADGVIPPGDDEPPRAGLTIFEYAEFGGPGFGGCPKTGAFTIPVPLP